MPNQFRASNAKTHNQPIVPVAVIYGKITLFTRIKLWFKGVKYV